MIKGRAAVLFYNGDNYSQIAMKGEPEYDRNVVRKQDFIVPIMVPADMDVEDVLPSLNRGEKRILKSGAVGINVDGQTIEHARLSKR